MAVTILQFLNLLRKQTIKLESTKPCFIMKQLLQAPIINVLSPPSGLYNYLKKKTEKI